MFTKHKTEGKHKHTLHTFPPRKENTLLYLLPSKSDKTEVEGYEQELERKIKRLT